MTETPRARKGGGGLFFARWLFQISIPSFPAGRLTILANFWGEVSIADGEGDRTGPEFLFQDSSLSGILIGATPPLESSLAIGSKRLGRWFFDAAAFRSAVLF